MTFEEEQMVLACFEDGEASPQDVIRAYQAACERARFAEQEARGLAGGLELAHENLKKADQERNDLRARLEASGKREDEWRRRANTLEVSTDMLRTSLKVLLGL